MIGVKRTLVSLVVSLVLVATALTSVWLLASAGVFTASERPLAAAPARTTESTAAATSGDSVAVGSGFQVAQPRDPFVPLIVVSGTGATTTIGDGAPTTTSGSGSDSTTTTAGDGSSTTTLDATTTTSLGNTPDGLRVVLLEVREDNGSLIAVVEVDGETSTVGVGDMFADSFKVVSLTASGGVFTFGDSAFTLAVGQSIFK